MPILHSMCICALKASWTCGNGAPVTESCGSIYYASLNAPHLLLGHVYAYITLNSPCVHFRRPRCVGMTHLLQSHVHASITFNAHVCTSSILDVWEWCTCYKVMCIHISCIVTCTMYALQAS